jgi:hypothetical protein
MTRSIGPSPYVPARASSALAWWQIWWQIGGSQSDVGDHGCRWISKLLIRRVTPSVRIPLCGSYRSHDGSSGFVRPEICLILRFLSHAVSCALVTDSKQKTLAWGVDPDVSFANARGAPSRSAATTRCPSVPCERRPAVTRYRKSNAPAHWTLRSAAKKIAPYGRRRSHANLCVAQS